MLASTKRCTRSGFSCASLAEGWMGDQHSRVVLEDRRHREYRNVFLHKIQRNEGVWREVEIEPAGGEQLRVVDLGSALPQRHVEPVLPVNPSGDRLVVAAVLGLGL